MEYIPAKTIVTKTKKPSEWFGIDYNMNIYRGCNHGCIYCDSRSDCYGIENFDQIQIKKDALQIIRDDLRRKVKKGVVATGSMSDPYNPLESELKLTRHALELCNAFEFGVAIATKSTLLSRDIDILSEIKEHSPVLCKVTITTCDDDLAALLEPHAPSSSERFELIRQLADRGIYAGILLMPVLPFIEDTQENIQGIIERAHAAGARFIYPAFGVTLRNNQRDHFFRKLTELFPEEDYASMYRKRFGTAYSCHSPRLKSLVALLQRECEKRGICYRMNDIIHAYQRKYQVQQLSLFDLER